MADGLRDRAVEVGDHLAASVPGVNAICLYGSVARGEEREGSDIDLLVVGSDPTLTASELRKRLPGKLREEPVALAYHTPQSLGAYLHRWSRFAAHVRREGEVLFDSGGWLQQALAEEIPISTRDELAAQERHLENYDDLKRFGGYFLLPLAHLYSIGRGVIFALLAERGHLEFDQERAMSYLEGEAPEATEEIRLVARLRPFRERVARRGAGQLPFSPRDCEAEVARARDAIRGLIGLSQQARVRAD